MFEDTAADVSSAAVAIVIVLSLAAAVILARAVRRTARAGEWTGTAVMAAGLVFFTASYVGIIATYADQWVTTTDVYRNVTSTLPAWGTPVTRATLVVLAAAAIVITVVRARKPGAVVNIPAVLLALVVLLSMGSSVLHGDSPFRPYTLVFLVVIVATTVAPRGIGIHVGVGTAAALFAVVSGLALAINPAFSAIACQAGQKCGYLGFNFRGVLDNENALGLMLTLSIPYVYMAFRGWEGTVLAVYLVGLTFFSGSRSGLTAAVVTLVLLLVISPDARRAVHSTGRSLIVLGVLGVTFIGGVLLPFLPHEAQDFSGRAYLWQLAQAELSQPVNLFFGTGVLGWDHMRDNGSVDSSAVYSVHNEWLSVLYATGVFGLAAFVVAVGILLWQARAGYLTVVGCVLVPVFILAFTERPWPVDTMDWLTWVIPAALLCYAPPESDATASAEPESVARTDIDIAEGVPT